jgi:hypothetical protein
VLVTLQAVFLLIGKTSALTMNIAGVVKDWMLIFFSFYLFKAPVTSLNLLGYVFCCSGVRLGLLANAGRCRLHSNPIQHGTCQCCCVYVKCRKSLFQLMSCVGDLSDWILCCVQVAVYNYMKFQQIRAKASDGTIKDEETARTGDSLCVPY